MESTFKSHLRDVRVKMESDVVEPQSGNCSICKEPGHRQRTAQYLRHHWLKWVQMLKSIKLSMIENGQEAAGVDRIGEDRVKHDAVMDRAEEAQEWENVARRVEDSQTEVSCIRWLQKGHLATACPRHVKGASV